MEREASKVLVPSSNTKLNIISELCFYIALLIEILIVIVDKSALINPIEGKLFQITFVLCTLKIMMTKYNLKEWVLIAIFIIIGLISDQVTNRNEIIRFVAFVAASKGINNRRALKMVFCASTIGVLLLVALALTGTMGSMFIEADFYRGVGVERRYCLGLGHPNALHCMFWALLTLGVYIYFEKCKWWYYLLMMVLDVGLYLLTDSRTGLIMSLFVIVGGMIASVVPDLKKSKYVYAVSCVIYFICIGFSVRIACYDGVKQKGMYPMLEWLDSKLTGRILDSGVSGNICKWSLFSDSGTKGYMDMGYIKLFHWYGIVPAIIYLSVIILMIVSCYRENDIAALILIMSFTVYSLVEAHAVSPYIGRNYMLMLLFGTWSQVFRVNNGIEGYFWQIKKYLALKV